MSILYQNFKSPFGELIIGSFNGELVLCDWKHRKMRHSLDNKLSSLLHADFMEENDSVIEHTIVQLSEYFNKERTEFDLPLRLVGSDFQQSVWKALLKIPYGKTSSYLKLSRLLGNEKAIRAVAAANGANTIAIIIPCHRIIGADGSLVGYAGGVQVKKKLLQLENPSIDGQLDLF